MVIEIPNGISEHVREVVSSAGIRGLSTEAAQELGVFDRISYLICTMHACICAAYRVYGSVDVLLTEMGGRRHEIKRACNDFEKAVDRFMDFWRLGGYQTKEGAKEMGWEIENLYHQVMRWAQIPEEWSAGDPQHTKDVTDAVISAEINDKILRFHRTEVESEIISDVDEDWCVTVLDTKTKMQKTVEEHMDKASAQMVAKRISKDDPKNIYTASMMQTFTEKRTECCPVKAYMNGDVIGKIGKELRVK